MKRYQQYCGLARALELVGDRWTLLVVRELLYLGDRRFTDLQTALAPIAPNLLTARLRHLEDEGLLERVTRASDGATVYRLTDTGRTIEKPVTALMQWGTDFLGPVPARAALRPELPAMALRAAFRPEAAAGIDTRFRFHVDETAWTMHVHDHVVDLLVDDDEPAGLTLRTNLPTFVAIAAGRRDAADAAAAGDLQIEGDSDALRSFSQLFGRPDPT